MFARVLACLLPGTCQLCRDHAADLPALCRGCAADLPRPGPACERCATPRPAHAVCPVCVRGPPPQRRTVCPYRYASPVSDLVHMMKFGARVQVAHLLGTLLARHLVEVGAPVPALIVPVPLHPRRLRERGFNQALEIARPVARLLGVPADGCSLTRVRASPPQASLAGARARIANVRGVFRVGRRLSRVSHVALVDDVVTTGATVGEIARQLRKAGVRRVDVWACARARSGRHEEK